MFMTPKKTGPFWPKYKALTKALTRVSVYQTQPPYNLNWYKKFKFLDDFLRSNPITVVDVGARDGSCQELETLQSYIEFIGFDADADACVILNARTNIPYKTFKIYPFFVGKSQGPQTFNLYKNPGESSQLLPNIDFRKSFNEDLRIEKTVTVEGITLDQFVEDNHTEVDVLKLDSQGTEYEILANGYRVVSTALMIECEVEFIAIYENQKLFHDISDLLYKKNFSLLYLNRVFANRTCFKGLARGQIIFGDALFGLNEVAVRNLSWERKKKYCVLLINYGHIDYAYEIFCNDAELREKSPELERFFKNQTAKKRSIIWTIKVGLWTQIEKILFLVLIFRKTNHLNHDSDRSWPIR
jgi:FkbM family methyltransferase